MPEENPWKALCLEILKVNEETPQTQWIVQAIEKLEAKASE